MSSKIKLIISLFLVGLPVSTFADNVQPSENYGGVCPVCEEQNRPVIDVEEINAKFEIFTDANNYQWCEEQQRYYVWGKCSGPTLTSGVTTKNAKYTHTGEVYNSDLNTLVYEGTCEGAEPTLVSGVKTKNAIYKHTGKVYNSEDNSLVYEGTCEGTFEEPEIKGSGSCEAKVTKDTDGNIQSVECTSVATATPTPPPPPACANDPLFERIGSVCTLRSDEADCDATSDGTYQCVGGKVECSGNKPTCLIPCDEMPIPTQGELSRNGSYEKKFITAHGKEKDKGAIVGYTCVRTNAQYSKVGEFDAGMFGWHHWLYDKNYAQMITAGITGGKTPIGWDDDRGYFKQNRKDAQAAYNNGTACYVCGSIRINGCFAPETKLTLADGSVKQAKDVATGDVLFNPVTKKGVTVEKVIEGPEDAEMVLIEYAGGSLKVSQEHPVLTKNGLVQAKELKAGDTVYNGENQEFEVASVKTLPVEEGQYVINFIVKVDGDIKDYKNRMLLSEGVVTGDLTTQIELQLGK